MTVYNNASLRLASGQRVEVTTVGGGAWVKYRAKPGVPDAPAIKLQYIPNRRQAAIISAVAFMANVSPKLYFWTFTVPQTVPDWWFGNAFTTMFQRVRRKLGECSGVRVFELHPGGHGLHAHVVVNRRYPVTEVRRIAEACGFGIVNVKRVSRATIAELGVYIGGYLGKEGHRVHFTRKTGVWGMGVGRVRNMECQSRGSEEMRDAWAKAKGGDAYKVEEVAKWMGIPFERMAQRLAKNPAPCGTGSASMAGDSSRAAP